MNVVGYVFLALIALVILAGLTIVARSLPDIRRYLRMRRM
jgi:hypothetical protein